jgi:hypothetical protein
METNANQGIGVVLQALRGGGQQHGSVGTQAGDGEIGQLSDATRERIQRLFRERVADGVRERLAEVIRELVRELVRHRLGQDIRTVLLETPSGPAGRSRPRRGEAQRALLGRRARAGRRGHPGTLRRGGPGAYRRRGPRGPDAGPISQHLGGDEAEVIAMRIRERIEPELRERIVKAARERLRDDSRTSSGTPCASGCAMPSRPRSRRRRRAATRSASSRSFATGWVKPSRRGSPKA